VGESTVAVRRAVAADSRSLADLSTELGYPATEASTRRRLESISGQADHALYVAEGPSLGVVGWIHVFLALRLESEPFAEIGGLVVGAANRGRGIGRALVAAAGGWGAQRGAATLRVRSNVVREGAREFYLRLGFAISKSQTVFVRSVDG
jgi:GNAT superfamily N-acetyltransferase